MSTDIINIKQNKNRSLKLIDINVTRFAGGLEDGMMFQISIGHMLDNHTIQLTTEQAKQLAIEILKYT